MLSRSTRWQRLPAGLVLLLHLLVAGLAPLADARLAEASPWVEYTHIEAPHDTPCVPAPHDHLFCQTCRLVDQAGLPDAASLALVSFETARLAALPLAQAPAPHGTPLSSLRPRAPPLL